MSRLICNSCGADLGEYNSENNIIKCKNCSSEDISRKIFLTDNIKMNEQIRGKSTKIPKKKKPATEFIVGDDYSKSKKKYVTKFRKIDRLEDHYYEKVIDTDTGETIHECNEKLSEHVGHGSDKKRKIE